MFAVVDYELKNECKIVLWICLKPLHLRPQIVLYGCVPSDSYLERDIGSSGKTGTLSPKKNKKWQKKSLAM